MENKNILVLENVNHLDEYISAYLNDNYPKETDFNIVKSLHDPENPVEKYNELVTNFKSATHVYMSTRLNDQNQILKMLQLFNSDDKKRSYYIIMPPAEAQLQLNIIARDNTEIKQELLKLFVNNEIYEIGAEVKEEIESNKFFKKLYYYFDTVQMEYNKKFDLFIKMRNFYIESNYSELYTLKPVWINKNIKVKTEIETFVYDNAKEIDTALNEIFTTLDYRLESNNDINTEDYQYNLKIKNTMYNLYKQLKNQIKK